MAPCKAKPSVSRQLKIHCCWFHRFPLFPSCSSLDVSAVTPARVVPLPLLPVPLSNAVLTLHQNVFPLQNRVGLVAGGFLDCIGLFFGLFLAGKV